MGHVTILKPIFHISSFFLLLYISYQNTEKNVETKVNFRISKNFWKIFKI